MKKVLSWLLVAVLVFMSFPVTLSAYADTQADEALGKIGLELLSPKQIKSADGTVNIVKGLVDERMNLAGRTYSSGVQLKTADGVASAQYSVKDMAVTGFYAVVGKNDNDAVDGDAVFKVYADDEAVYTSSALGLGEAETINVDLPAQAETVKLEVTAATGDTSVFNFADAGFTYAPSENNTGVIYLSDMNIDFSACATGAVVLDMNINQNGPITIEGQTFEKGISLHPFPNDTAVYVYDITNSGAKTFSTYVGQCDTANIGGNGVICTIYIDGAVKYQKEFQYNTPAEHVELDVSAAGQIVLEIDPIGGHSSDAFSFGDAKLLLNNPSPDQLFSYNTINMMDYELKTAYVAGTGPWINKTEGGNPLFIRNTTFKEGMCIHPFSNGPGYIEWDISSLNGDFFTVKVGKTNQTANYAASFKVYADGRLVDQTDKLYYGEWYAFKFDVADVKVVRLVVDPEGDWSCDESVYAEPTLYYSSEKGSVHIDSPYIKDSSALYNTKTIEITGHSYDVDSINVMVNGADVDVVPDIDEKGNFKFTLTEFERSYSVVTVQGIVDGKVSGENTIAFTLPVGNVLSVYQMDRLSVSTNGEIWYGKDPYSGSTKLEIGSGAFSTEEGFCVHPGSGNFDVSYSLADYQEYRYVEVAVGRDDRAPITWGQSRGSAMCYILCDDKVVAQTSDYIGAGEYEILSAEIPEGTQKITFRTTNGDGSNTSDYIDWLEPMLCKSKDAFYRTEQTAFNDQSAKSADAEHSLAVRFNAAATVKGITFSADAIDKDHVITAKVYKFLYSRTRSMQEAAIVEKTFTPVENGSYTVEFLTETEAGEYLLVIENATGIKYSDSELGAVYIDGKCVNGFADITVAFSVLSNTYFNAVSQEGEVYNTSFTTAAEKARARSQIEGYLNDLSTFPSTVTIGGTKYNGFGTGFNETNRKTETDDKSETTVITLEHTSGLVFELTVVFYPDYAAFDWVANFSNPTDANSPMVTDFYIADLKLEGEDPYFFTSHGETPYITTYLPLHYHLKEGDSYFYDADTGRSSEENSWPYYNIEYGDKGMFAAVGWPGWWESNLGYQNGAFTFSASQSALNTYLEPGESFRTPLMAFVLYDGRDLSRATNLWRHWFIDCNFYTEEDGKLFEPGIVALTTQYTHESLNTTEDEQKSVMQTFADYGIELDYWWMDAGWYVLPDYAWDNASPWLFTGNWEVDPERFPTGLKSVSELAEKYDIKTILWFEPERVGMYVEDLEELSKTSDNVVKPEWLVAIDENYEGVVNSSPFNILDLSNPECVDWLIETVSEILVNAKISIYREDFNVAPKPAWMTQDGTAVGVVGRGGSVENEWVQGHLEYWDALLALDNIEMIDSCASGGHRLDLECMRRAVTLHEADYDYTDQVAKQVMTYTVGQWLPYFGTFTGPELYDARQYDLRSCYRPSWALAYKVEDSRFGEDDIATVKAAVDEFNSIKKFYYSDLYQLTDWNISQDRWYSYEYFEPEWNEGYAMVYRRDGDNAPDKQYIRLQGLNPDDDYIISLNDAGKAYTMSGLEAMERGVPVVLETSNSSEIIRIAELDPADSEAAERVTGIISELGDITLEKEADVVSARNAYNELTDVQKALVINEDILVAAEEKIQTIKADTAAAKTVSDMIAAIGEITSLEKEAAVTAAREAYNNLTDSQKLMVTNESLLVVAEEAIAELKKLTVAYGDLDNNGSVTASDALLALQAAVKKITLTDEQITAADVDKKTGITAADALLILQRAVGKINSFPIEEKQ